MIATLQAFAFSLPVLWARMYTLGLPTHERADRIDLVASDVYEQRFTAAEERRSPFALLETIVCLLRSIWADLTWRFERGHALRVAAVRAGTPPFPVLVTAVFALAGIAGAARLSIFHDIPEDEHIALVLALLVGPLVAVLGVIIARQSLPTGILALAAGTGAIGFAAWSTLIAPVAAAIGFIVGLFYILETRNARRTSPATGRSAAPTNPLPPPSLDSEMTMDSTDKLARWLSLGALLLLLGLIGTFWHDASFPFDGTDAEIREWYADGHEAQIYGSFFMELAGGVGLLLFFGGLYARLRRSEGGSGYLSALTLVAVGIAVAVDMVATSLGHAVGMAYAYDDKFEAGGIDPQTVRMLSALGFGLAAMSAAALAVALGAVATVALRYGRVFPRWLAWATVAVAVLLLLNFPLFNAPMSLFVFWALVVAGFQLFRSQTVTPSVTQGTSPAPA